MFRLSLIVFRRAEFDYADVDFTAGAAEDLTEATCS